MDMIMDDFDWSESNQKKYLEYVDQALKITQLDIVENVEDLIQISDNIGTPTKQVMDAIEEEREKMETIFGLPPNLINPPVEPLKDYFIPERDVKGSDNERIKKLKDAVKNLNK